MNSTFRRLVIFLFLLPALGNAQITMPTSRIVFQRGNDNRASVPIQGNCPTSANSIQVKANAVGVGSSIDWTTIGTTADGVFMGNISLQGGWYSLQVRALANGSQVGSWSIDRVGVGEVFAIAGQSNILGSPYARNLSATDDRVSTVNYRGYPDGNITEGDLPTSFINATNNSPIGPENNMLFWGDLGDKLVARLGVPVMFLGGAYGGTSSKNWRDAAVEGTENMDTQGGRLTKNSPYRALGIALSYYVKRTGIRSIIWHQGESDPNTSQGEYVSNVSQLIDKTRSQTGMNRLSWMICRATYLQGHTNPAVIAAQNQLADAGNNCFAGPATDFMSGSQAWRFDDAHINDDKYPVFEGLFNDILNVGYFNNSQPSQPSYTPSITTGYIFPHERNGGDHIQVPYMATAPVRGNNQYVVQLVDENGTFLADLGAGSVVGNNLIDVQLPVWADGRVRVRVNSTAPARNGEVSEFFIAHKTGDRPSGNPVVNGSFAAQNMVSGTSVNVTLPSIVSDPANLSLTYSWQNLPAGLNASGLTISGTPTGSARTETATLMATNSAGNSVSTPLTINIASAVVAPIPAPTPAPVTPVPTPVVPVTPAPVTPTPVVPVTPVTPAPTPVAPVTPTPVTPTPVTPVTPAPVTPAPIANACGFTEGQFLFTFYGERVYAHFYNGILFAAYQNASEGYKSQIWVRDAGSVSGFDMTKVSCFATVDPRTSPPIVVTPAPVTPVPVTPTPVAPVTPTPVTPVTPVTPTPVAPVTPAPVAPTPVAPVAPVTPTPVTPAPIANACGFTEGQFLFTFYGERIYAHFYNGILFAAYQNASEGYKSQIWVRDAGSVSGFDMTKVSCFATVDPRTSPPIVVTPAPVPPAPVTPAPVAPVTPVPVTPAPVIPTTTQSVISPEGYVDISECGRQYGWARDGVVANKAVSVLIYWDNTLVSNLTADQYRNDLAAAFGDNGKHGFNFDTPMSLQSAGSHQVKIQIDGAASPFHVATVNCANRARVAAAESVESVWGVYPNPVADVLTLTVPPAYQDTSFILSVVSAGGKSISLSEAAASSIAPGQRKLDVSELQTGMYILRVVVNNKMVATLKIIKQ